MLDGIHPSLIGCKPLIATTRCGCHNTTLAGVKLIARPDQCTKGFPSKSVLTPEDFLHSVVGLNGENIQEIPFYIAKHVKTD